MTNARQDPAAMAGEQPVGAARAGDADGARADGARAADSRRADGARADGGRPRAASGARARARAEISREITDEARRQLATEGAQQLSLRAVARQLGMASSALYRYFPSRDDLLTALIIDAYNALGMSAEAAAAARPEASVRARWRACCHAVRDWAIGHPHEYALIYGSPVVGYRAPAETIAPAARVAMVIGGLVSELWPADPGQARTGQARTGQAGTGQAGTGQASTGQASTGQASTGSEPPLPGLLAGQVTELRALMAPGVPAPVMGRLLIAWTQLFGMISFELFGQLVGSADPSDDFFGYAVEQMADLVGLPEAR